MLEAILMFSPYSSLVPKMYHKERVKYHWIFQALSLVTAFLGFVAIYEHKQRNKVNPVHFTSWHSWFGIAAIVFAAVNCLGGIGMLYPKSKLLNPSGLKLWVRKRLHALFGCLVFLTACATLVLSLYSNWFNKVAGEFIWYAMLALITVLASVVTNQISNEFIFKKKSGGSEKS